MLTLTVDIEQYASSGSEGRFLQSLQPLLNILTSLEAQVTFFIVGDLVHKSVPLIRELHENGHEIALHGYSHQFLKDLGPTKFRSELIKGKELIEDIVQEPTIGFRAPYFSLTKEVLWAPEILGSEGFVYSSSVLPSFNPQSGYPEAPREPFRWPNGLIEFPSPTLGLGKFRLPILGGAYLRLSPKLLVKVAQRISTKKQGAWSYCHPYDFDIDEEFNDDADLLTPAKVVNWASVFKRPHVVLGISLFIFILLSSRSRFGSLIGGALATTPHGTSSLWRSYIESWHQVGMGSSAPTPPWVALLSLLSILFFGKPAVLITSLIFLAPALMAFSAYKFLKLVTANAWLRVSASMLYAISPVAIASVNTGRLGTLMILILLPLIVASISSLDNFERISWRRIFGVALLISIATSFTLMVWLAVLVVTAVGVGLDIRSFNGDLNKELFDQRLKRRIALLVTPLIVTAPWSLVAIIDPNRFLYEPGILLSGGGPNLAFLGNPGGPGALPWWAISPLTLVLIVAYFASTQLHKVAQIGTLFLLLSVALSALSITGNGTIAPTQLWVGVFLAIATLAAVTVGTIILNDLRDYLIATNVNYRHILSACLLIITLGYSTTAISWNVSQASSSPVYSKSVNILPEYLGVETDAKTLVLREITNRELTSLAFYISRGSDITLGEPDVAPIQDPAIARAVIELADGSGLTTSKTFADFGIKYLFAKNPIDKDMVRTIDGLGGFARTSATTDGIVWKVSEPTGRLVFTNIKGEVTLLASGGIGVTTNVPGPGVITLTENYDLGWQILQNGLKLERSENEAGLPQFKVIEAGEFTLIHDGTLRRGALSLQFIAWVVLIILTLPAGRRKREISEMELS